MARKIYKGGDYSEAGLLLFKLKWRFSEFQGAAWLDIGVRITVKSCLKKKY